MSVDSSSARTLHQAAAEAPCQPSTTLDIYTHAFDKNKKAASAGLQGMQEN